MISARQKNSLNKNYMMQHKGTTKGYKPLLLRDTLSPKNYDLTERGVKTSMAERTPLNLALNPQKAREMNSSGPATQKNNYSNPL